MHLRKSPLNQGAIFPCDTCRPDDGGFTWLGQAGFAVALGAVRFLIDPYLSNSLEAKYRTSEFSHARMMESPIEPGNVPDIDYVLCTHRHSDHMDPGSLPAISNAHPECRFIVPRAEIETAVSMGVPARRLIGIDAGETLALAAGVTLTAVPAAHESLTRNDRGEYAALGYIVGSPRATLYHSGDCVPYEGLSSHLVEHRIDVALLPVNGRRASLSDRGIAGNFTLEEAAALCREAGISWLIPHHFGMFAFNTVDRTDLARKLDMMAGNPCCLLPEISSWIDMNGGCK